MQSNEPYIGSVRFFKNIIFLCCILGVLIPTGLALRWRSRAKTAESLLAQNAVVLTGEEDEAASEAEAASVETEPEADSSDEQEPLSYQLLYPDFYAPTPLPDIEAAATNCADWAQVEDQLTGYVPESALQAVKRWHFFNKTAWAHIENLY